MISVKNNSLDSIMVNFTVFILVVFQFLSSFSLYYFWSPLNIISYGVFFLFNIILYINSSCVYDIKYNKKIAYTFFGGWFFVFLLSSLFSMSFHFDLFYMLWGFFFLLYRDDLKLKIFETFLRIITIILFISVIEYLFYILGGRGIILGSVEREEAFGTQYFDHLIFNLVQNGFTPRFQSISEEPGLVGTLCAFLIYLVKFQKGQRFTFIIIWVSGLLTMSFAFYVLAIINILSSLIIKKKLELILVLFILLVIIACFIKGTVLYDLFILKIEDRIIVENVLQRNDDSLDKIFVQSFNNGKILFGHGHGFQNSFGVGGSGAKIWIIQYGLLNFFIIFFIYCKLFFRFLKRYKSKLLNTIIFLGIFWISFYQRHYIIYPSYVLLFFTCPLLYARTFVNQYKY